MSPATKSRYTLLIPTNNRPNHLRALLGYLSARRFKYPVRVLDSSFPQAVSENRETINRVGIEATHHIYAPDIDPLVKFALAAQAVETPYISFCADDDFVLARGLDRLLDFLDGNSG